MVTVLNAGNSPELSNTKVLMAEKMDRSGLIRCDTEVPLSKDEYKLFKCKIYLRFKYCI